MANKKDLDYPLYKYWIFYKFDDNLNTKQLLIQKLKVFSIFIIILLNIFRYAFYLYQSEPNKLLPMNHGDLLQYIMPNKEFGYILVNALQSMSLIFLIILNTSNKSDYKWFEIIDAFNGYETYRSIGLYDKIYTKYFVKKVNLIYFILTNMFKFMKIVLFLMSIFIFIIYFIENFETMVLGIMTIALYYIFVYAYFPNIMCVLCYYLMVCFYFKYRIKSFNNYFANIETKCLFKNPAKLNEIIISHNKLCLDIKLHNKFWKNIYFTVSYILLPVNTIFIQLFLFDTSLMGTKLLYLMFLFSCLSFLLALNIITSDINVNISKSCDTFYSFYFWQMSGLNLAPKFKVSYVLVY